MNNDRKIHAYHFRTCSSDFEPVMSGIPAFAGRLQTSLHEPAGAKCEFLLGASSWVRPIVKLIAGREALPDVTRLFDLVGQRDRKVLDGDAALSVSPYQQQVSPEPKLTRPLPWREDCRRGKIRTFRNSRPA